MAQVAAGSSASWVPLPQDLPHRFLPSPSLHCLRPQTAFQSMLASRKFASSKLSHFGFAFKGSGNGTVFSSEPDPGDIAHRGAAPEQESNSPSTGATREGRGYVSLEGTSVDMPSQSWQKSLHNVEDEDEAKSRRTSKNEPSSSTSEADSLWRNIFPAYMRSKEEEGNLSLEGDTSPSYDFKGLGAQGAAAARAAAAAAASAMESHVNSSPGTSPGGEAGKRLKDLITDDPIWAAIRAEARLEAEREPLLSSFLYASILAHPCFERSLGFVLANRLQNATLLATQLMDVFDDVFTNDANIKQAIRLDVQAVKDRDPSCRSYSSALLYLKGYHAIQSYRVAHALWNRRQMVLALALQSRISEVFAVDIHPAARIGKAILLDHGTGVVIGETAVVGDRVSMLQGVTLGGTGKVAGDRHPKIGEGVLIGAGATILGNIKVGRGAMVAAGSLVLKDVPSHSMVAGTPARVVGVLEESTPSLTMKHDVTKDRLKSLEDDTVFGGTGI